MIYIKKHKEVLAACDQKLVGKQIGDLKLNESFYKGQLVEKEQFHQELLNSQNINLIGEKTIAWASEQIEFNTSKENNIPYAIIFKV